MMCADTPPPLRGPLCADPPCLANAAVHLCACVCVCECVSLSPCQSLAASYPGDPDALGLAAEARMNISPWWVWCVQC